MSAPVWAGVTVEWTENPLAAKVTADDARLSRLRNSITSEAEAEGEPHNTPANIQRRINYCIAELLGVHCGDCTFVLPSSATR
jgi:hypothetical protein